MILKMMTKTKNSKNYRINNKSAQQEGKGNIFKKDKSTMNQSHQIKNHYMSKDNFKITITINKIITNELVYFLFNTLLVYFN